MKAGRIKAESAAIRLNASAGHASFFFSCSSFILPNSFLPLRASFS
jgi:hypothetical protein